MFSQDIAVRYYSKMKSETTVHRTALAWDDFRLILAIGELGSLTRAAAKLGLSHPTLSRRLREAERRLDCRLVERSPQTCRLTPAGMEMRDLAIRMSTEIDDLERRLVGRDGTPTGQVRITAPDAVADYLLSGILGGLTRSLPGITVELVVSNQVLSLAQRAADIAVRVTDRPDPALKGRRIATVGMAVYGTQALADAADPAARGPWIGFEAGLACSGPGKWLDHEIPADLIRFRANTLLGAARAVSQGTGFGLLPCFIGETLADVVRIGNPIAELDTGLWLLVHPDVADLPRLKSVRQVLAKELTGLSEIISGR